MVDAVKNMGVDIIIFSGWEFGAENPSYGGFRGIMTTQKSKFSVNFLGLWAL